MAANLNTVAARDKLKPRDATYWQKLDSGCHLGFRRLTSKSVGSWYARYNNSENGERPKKSLGEFGGLPASERFSAAKREAEAWFEHLGKGGQVRPETVKALCANYVDHLRATKGDKAADDAKGRFTRWIDNSPIGQVEVNKLTMARVEKWRNALAATQSKVSRDNRETPLTRPRAASTVNRDMTALRSALNYAHTRGHVTSDLAWLVALKPFKNADGRRVLYLDRDQRRALLKAAAPDIRTFLHCLSLLPLRPGALAHLAAGQFISRLSTLVVGRDKAGGDRSILLPPATAKLFAAATQGKPAEAPLLSRADGTRWNKDSWKGPIKDAAQLAGLSTSTTAYTLRHSVITDLVVGGLDLLTVAQLAGTSVVMIERHYGHLRKGRAAEALASLEL